MNGFQTTLNDPILTDRNVIISKSISKQRHT
uniref:Uncharacterized protein n=1 Tax=Podoviridae sp. ctzXp5 TaxID=2827758 RepID=A0A8S5TEB0_9CAUD|nr:MAG TPA: hypothetical protein [Podoviridae sp. ctzXp5]DAP48291.1 MAG TPA: hypothetical protein [Caudoviricetes sp.]DAS37305.1 MAG TPA: hypothetical protein [Caudoviricetes sp.]